MCRNVNSNSPDLELPVFNKHAAFTQVLRSMWLPLEGAGENITLDLRVGHIRFREIKYGFLFQFLITHAALRKCAMFSTEGRN